MGYLGGWRLRAKPEVRAERAMRRFDQHAGGCRGGAARFACLVGLAATVLLAGRVRAQQIEGTLSDRETGRGIEGAFVMALDEAGAARAGALTDEDGHFVIALPSAGSYALSAQRIGYRSTESVPVRVGPGETRTFRMRVATEAVALADLNVTAERRCALVEGAGVTLTRLWDEARKAMLVAEWTREAGVVAMEIEDFRRTLDPRTLAVSDETRTAREFHGSRPYRSLSPEALAEEGYVVQRVDGTYYFAPDESVLLSRAFLESHCFTPRRDPEKPGLIGLAFEPIRESPTPDIRGAFWLDEETAELRFVDYRYSRLLERATAPEAGGRVEFQRLDGGAWIVSRWYIRMPQLAAVRDPRAGRRLTVMHYVEEGGRVVRTVDQQEVRARTRAVIEGRVEGRSGQSLPRAVVFLSGTQYRTVSDDEGRFRLEDLPPGRYPLVFRHDLLERAGVYARPVEVDLVAGDTVRLTLRVPPGGPLR